jgi:hypothetical protein
VTDPTPERYDEDDAEIADEDDDFDGEETQVTRLLSGMKEVVFEQVACTQDLGRQADRVSRMARRPKSVQGLRAVSVLPTEPAAAVGE